MATRTKDELGMALGCVVYDALILLVALSVFRRRRQYAVIAGLTWGEPQIAHDVILLKCRSLMDFMSPGSRHEDDIVIMDFGVPAIKLPKQMQSFRRSVNKWTVHLSWQRVLRRSAEAPQPLQSGTETCALWLLAKMCTIISEIISAGIVLIESRHQRFYTVLKREYPGVSAGLAPLTMGVSA